MNSLQDTVYKYTTRMFLIHFKTNSKLLQDFQASCYAIFVQVLTKSWISFIQNLTEYLTNVDQQHKNYELQTNCNTLTFQVRICSPVFHSHCLKSKLLLAVTQNWKILKSDNYKRELLSTGHLWGVTFIKLKIPCRQDLQQSSL